MLNSLWIVCELFNVPHWTYKHERHLWDGAYDLYSLSEKTWKSDHMRMSLQRQHFLLNYFKTLSYGLVGVELTTSRMATRCPTNWATGARSWRSWSSMHEQTGVNLDRLDPEKETRCAESKLAPSRARLIITQRLLQLGKNCVFPARIAWSAPQASKIAYHSYDDLDQSNLALWEQLLW